ncbi:MAG: hypothetical protein ACYC6G_17205 [Desulfobaccales bacterium]
MALYPIKVISPCMSYPAWNGVVPTFFYKQYLVTPPRIYSEQISRLTQFFYEGGTDKYVAYAWLDIINWPGWSTCRYTWDAETGAFLGKQSQNIVMNYVNRAGNGSFGKIFATFTSGSSVQEVTWDSLAYVGGWQANPGTWSPGRIFSHIVVNLQDGLLVGVNGSSLETWNINGTPTLLSTLRIPYGVGYLAFEDRQSCWIITTNGFILKANYRVPRWEMLSGVQNPSADATGYLAAFDTKRKRLGVLRLRPNNTDGACQNQIEIYRPIYRVAGLTEPVPVSPLRADERVHFVAHLYGDAGEGVAGYMVNADLGPDPLGQLLTPASSSELNGALTFRYQAPGAGEDTLHLSAP